MFSVLVMFIKYVYTTPSIIGCWCLYTYGYLKLKQTFIRFKRVLVYNLENNLVDKLKNI